ncbi:hypothetical protein PV08_03020 [Exophiala spinifera]|uniref:C2H2-type domain-containing protein n=1 Tax=Exophiala spinifera TaxID=91928 RepID=A0A0D1YTZ0_9EURO|nr:uncharacterized protein PV08_03020 [Exophiala spinifera]KIW18731.1 hypothetical protein PV08_03020 [Exophiala spinifera]
MATSTPRTRDQPDIRARISITDESTQDIKERLQEADQRQRALRSQQSWHSSDTNGALQRAVLRKTRTIIPHRQSRLSDDLVSDALPYPLKRSNSFNSLSTLQREADGAALSLYRGSPISAISPPCVGPTYQHYSIDSGNQDPCPPRAPAKVEILNAHRRYLTPWKKSIKKRKSKKVSVKAQKEDEQIGWPSAIADWNTPRPMHVPNSAQTLPVRTKSTKSITSQVVKTLSLGKLGRPVKSNAADPPNWADFDSKDELRKWMERPQSALDTAKSDLPAELPAELPQYTPFQDSTRTQHNEPAVLLEDTPANGEKDDVLVSMDSERDPQPSRSNSRSMRCDHCQNPIRLNQLYYHCSICEDGDRILCSACDQVGWSCRHDITEKVRSVSRAIPSRKTGLEPVHREQARAETQQHSATPWTSAIPLKPCTEGDRLVDSQSRLDKSTSPVNTPSGQQLNPTLQNGFPWNWIGDRDSEHRRRENDLAVREKEISLREKAASMREQQAALREREAALEVKQQLFTLQLQAAAVKQKHEAFLATGAQFEESAGGPAWVSINNSDQDDHVRTHANKRKQSSGRHHGLSPANSITSGQWSPLKRSPSGGHGQDPYDDDEDDNGSGTPKKLKHEPESMQSPEKLFACPFCKYDKDRYSERNVQEKHYRGCASGYWPDISRLKQHLYRVHWRRIHCVRCYTKFERKELLDQHVRESQPCALVECPYPEKFDDGQYNDIRRKRPANTPEQVWYIIYGVLFPGQPQPSTPYADNKSSQVGLEGVTQVPEQGAMSALGEVFESRLDQFAGSSEQTWLQSPAARDFIRQQLRASMSDVLERMRPVISPSLGNPSVEVSPYSAVPSETARRGSISLTPSTSVPHSPINGEGSVSRSSSDAQFLLPSHRRSFSRPFISRNVERTGFLQPLNTTGCQPSHDINNFSGPDTFPISPTHDPEHDQYDEECHSWTQGDDPGLAFNFDFDAGRTPAANSSGPDPIPQPATTRPTFAPVRLASLEPSSDNQAAVISQLKANHSNASSVDSGYGSLRHPHARYSSVVSGTQPQSRPTRGRVKGNGDRIADDGPSSPVPESAINWAALNTSLEDFIENAVESGMDEFGNIPWIPHQPLS